jgi:hypothetical protein
VLYVLSYNNISLQCDHSVFDELLRSLPLQFNDPTPQPLFMEGTSKNS